MRNLNLSLTKNKLWQYCHKLIYADKLAQKTVKRKLASLKKFCQWAVEKGLITRSPFEEGEESQEEIEGMREIREIRERLGKIGLVLAGVVLSVGILKMSLTKLPSSPAVPKPVPLPLDSGQILSQTSGFVPRSGIPLRGRERIGEIGEIGITATESALLANFAKEGRLVLPESLGVEAKEIVLKTTDAYDGSVTVNPDGRGILNLLFEGQFPKQATGGFVNIQNANLSFGNLIYAGVANDQTGFNFLEFQGGADLTSRFFVDNQGSVFTAGNLNLQGGQIQSSQDLIFLAQNQAILTLNPRQSHFKNNLLVSGQIFDGGLGIFGTTGEKLPQAFDFTQELTAEFEFLTGEKDLVIKFNLNQKQDKYYQARWQTDGKFLIEACQPSCSTAGPITHYPFEKYRWHHGRVHINDSYLTWELDLSQQKIQVPVQVETVPLLTAGYIEFSESFAAIANLKITQGGNPILTSGHGRVGGNLEVAGGVRLGQLSSQSSSTHICRNALGDLAECSADYVEWYPTSLREEILNSKSEIPNGQNSKYSETDLTENIAGTIISITNISNQVEDKTALYLAAPSKRAYDGNILGVLADPSLGANGRKLNETYQPLVLAGRVAVKVSDINGPVALGDAITSSEIPGVGMKATEAGAIVGKALEPWSIDQLDKLDQLDIKVGKILVLINPGWWEPEKEYATRNPSTIRYGAGTQHLPADATHQALQAGATREAKPSSGFTELVDNPLSQPENEVLSNSETMKFTSLAVERLRTTGQAEIANQLIIAALTVAGEATIAGQLTAESMEAKTAKISHLVADEIESETITTLEDQFGNLLAKVEELESEGKEGPEGQEEPEPAEEANVPNTSDSFENSALVAQVNQFIKELQEFHLDSLANPVNDLNISEDIAIRDTRDVIRNTQYAIRDTKKISDISHITYHISPLSFSSLTVTGSTSLGETTIAGNLLVDSSLQLAANSINSLNNTLYLQNYGFGGVDVLGGKVKIDPQGNLAIAGNVEVKKDLKVKRSLFANLLKPLEGEEVVVEGNLKTTGSGTFNKIVIASGNDTEHETPAPYGAGQAWNMEHAEETSAGKTPPASASPHPPASSREASRAGAMRAGNAEISSNATADTAILPAGETELTIINKAITDNSLIYITPLSPTDNKVLFVKVKKSPIQCEELEGPGGLEEKSQDIDSNLSALNSCFPQTGYFTVAIDEAIEKDIEFNWWVIN